MNIFSSYSVTINSNPIQNKKKCQNEKCQQNHGITMTLMTLCRYRRFENAKIGLGLCVFYDHE